MVEDLGWYVKKMSRVISEECGEALEKEVEPFHYFTEFLR